MGVVGLDAVQIVQIRWIEECAVVLQHSVVFLFKDAPVFAQRLVAILVILAILGHFVDEEQRQALDALAEQPRFLLQVRDDGLADLNPPHIHFRHVAHHVALADHLAIGKGHRRGDGVDIRDGIALVLLQIVGGKEQVVANGKQMGLPLDAAGFQRHFNFDSRHRRLLRRKHDGLQIHIGIRAPEVPHLEALDLDALHQPLVVGVQRVQHIHQVVLLGVGGGVIQHEQRVELFQRPLGHLAAHLLRLIHDDDRPVGGDHVDGPAAAEFIPLGVDDTRCGVALAALHVLLFVHGHSEVLHVDDHHVDAAVRGEAVQLVQVGAGVDEEPRLFVVQLHEVILSDFKGLLHALANGDGRHHDDELRPAVSLVQLEHGLDVDIGLARAGLHLHVQAAPPLALHQAVRQANVVV